jgi:phosphoglycerate dehydrogenase-like enzyme
MTVRGVRRRPERRRPAGVRWVGGPDALLDLARQSHVLVIAAPHTRATRGLVGDAVLRALPEGAFVLNLSRGDLLDSTALLMHLDSGHLAGCVLDVFGVEPLPPDDALWRHPRVLVTPHVSAVSERFWERESELIVENVDRYLRSARLKNLVDPNAGY